MRHAFRNYLLSTTAIYLAPISANEPIEPGHQYTVDERFFPPRGFLQRIRAAVTQTRSP